jgi:solute carrier family 26 (sodium-independent sulfate anion transporter), member 11
VVWVAARGGRVAATQEMVTLGLCNAAGALVGAMPATGAFTRSALAHCSGVRSPAAGLHCGMHLVLLARSLLRLSLLFC